MPDAGLNLYLSQYLGIGPEVLEQYGAFDVSVASDLPLIMDRVAVGPFTTTMQRSRPRYWQQPANSPT